MRVLYVDDDDDLAELMVYALSAEGIEVERASSVTSAQSHLQSAGFDIVATDLYLDDGDGLELIGAVPTVVMSGDAAAEARCLAAGAADFLAKPVAPTALAQALRALADRA